MSDSSVLNPNAPVFDLSSLQLPISSIIRAVCEAANGGPDLLYEVMIKMSLMVEATAPTYGLSIWATSDAGKPTLRWAEGLEEQELATAEKTVAEAGRIVHRIVGRHIFGEGDDSLEAVIVHLMTERRQTLALAESCTGGYIANRITNVPGASAVLLAGLVAYSNEAKQKFLGVRSGTLAKHGAVSDPVVREMAEGARRQTDANYALAVTGIAGPGGGTPDKPVGTVFIALATRRRMIVLNPINHYDRETFKYVTSQQALELLRRTLLNKTRMTNDP